MAELPQDTIFHYHSDDGITIKVDAIPLVRCRDCKHMKPFCYDYYLCGKNHVIPKGCINDWFCADGEKQEDE